MYVIAEIKNFTFWTFANSERVHAGIYILKMVENTVDIRYTD